MKTSIISVDWRYLKTVTRTCSIYAGYMPTVSSQQ